MDENQIEPVPDDKCSFPLTRGNKLRIFIDGFDSLTAITNEMKQAKESIWITASYFDVNLPLLMQDTIPGLLDFLEKLAKGEYNEGKSIDVRILFWSTNVHGVIEHILGGKTFSYHDESINLLKAQKHGNIKMRWDEKNYTGCQHQKSFIIDGEISFCGGVNMEASYIDKCNHPDPHPYKAYSDKAVSTHDYFMRIEGPTTACIMANFVQRWNEASLYKEKNIAHPNLEIADDLRFPEFIRYDPSFYELKEGPYYNAQVLRTIEKGTYTEPIPVPNWPEYNIRNGEYSIWHAYFDAINKAQKYIFIENQYFYGEIKNYMEIFKAMKKAADRGVKIFVIVPSYRMLDPITHYHNVPFINSLRASKNVHVMSLASSILKGRTYKWNDIYIHAKLMMVDDRWLTIGSANISHQSFDSHSEMNISVWSDNPNPKENLIKDLRFKLWSEYLRCSKDYIENLTIDEAFKLFEKTLRENKIERFPSNRSVTVLPWLIPEENYG